MPTDLVTFFYPKSVAIVGASRSPEKLGAIILKNIKNSGFKGEIYPINPKAEEIQGLKVYPDISGLESAPELVIVAIPACQVLEVLKQVGERGSKNVVILSAGFKEEGEEGAKLEKQLIETAEKLEINLLGPNCLGFVNNLHPINTTFGEPVKESGNLRFITQSGAIASGLFDWCNSTGLGISEFVTLGNKAGLNENDILQYFHAQDQNTLANHSGEGLSSLSPIGLYLESISNGGEFLRITKEITRKNPMFIIKPGKSEAAAKAMQSHTGSIAGADNVLGAVLDQAGVIRCHTLEDFFDLARAFAWEELPQGPKVAVVSNAGGPAVISADAISEEGLSLAQFDESTKKKLEEALPRSASIINPVDVLGDALADRFSSSLEAVMQTDEVDGLIVILTPQIMTQIEKTAEAIGEMSKKYKKPILCAFIGGNLVAEGEKKLNELKIPSFRYPERAIAALADMWKFKKMQLERTAEENAEKVEGITKVESENDVARQVIQEALNKKYKTLDNIAADKILSSVGIKTPPTKYVENAKEAEEFAQQNGWPVVLKLSSPGLLHKKDVGGVITGIINNEQLDDSWHKLERKIEQLDQKVKSEVKIQIQKEVAEGVEVIVGFKHDPTFGPVLLFGAGGSYAELIADRNLHLLPITKKEVENLVQRSKVYTILKGKDGRPSYALEKLYDLIIRVAKLETMIPEAEDIEINPVIVTLNDVWAVDGKIIMKEVEQKTAVSPPKLMTATCTKHEVLAEYFNYYEVETEEPFDFKPGQYISVKVAPNAIRAYSIATKLAPNKFALLVDIRPGGPGSKFFEHLKSGDKIPFLGPFGIFTLKLAEKVEKMVFLGTGSGMSAIRCMIDSALKEHNLKIPIKLYFGLTYVKEIFWGEYFEELKKEYPNFDYEISIFKPEESWSGHQGFITEVVEKDCPDASNLAAYLCGHRAMIADATELLQKHGCPKTRIYTERFV